MSDLRHLADSSLVRVRAALEHSRLVRVSDASCDLPGTRRRCIEKGREEKSLEQFFDKFDEGTEGDARRSLAIEFVYSDMWKQYLKVISKRCPNALNILDRFHVKSHLTKAVDETRKLDVAKLKSERKEEVLTKSKYIFLKNPENLTDKQAVKLKELLSCNLRVMRAYLMQCCFLK